MNYNCPKGDIHIHVDRRLQVQILPQFVFLLDLSLDSKSVNTNHKVPLSV